jgi:hypothetical protein
MMLRSLLLTASAALALGACQEQDQAGATASPAPSGAAARNAETALVKTETRKFRDWLAVCDNGNDCVAFGPALDGGAGGWVRVAMEAGPEARPRITVGLFDRVADPGALGLNIDGRRFVLTDLPVNGPQDSLGMIQNADPRIIAALTQARRLDLDLNQADAVALSPRGAAAALLWIDERQGRLDSTTALVRRGTKPASTVPAAPALPRLTPAAAAVQTNLPQPVLPAAFEARADVKQCRSDTAFSPTFQTNITVDRLSPDQELWGVPCFSGAYNFGLRYFVTGPNGVDPQALRFPTSREPADEVVTGEYDPGSRSLSGFNKGRGIGDCGIASVWVWTGRDFALQAESEMRECWGVPSDQWPTTWRSR